MRFKPHVIRRDTSRASGRSEPELPAELDFLAERLRDEAAGLADQYPAHDGWDLGYGTDVKRLPAALDTLRRDRNTGRHAAGRRVRWAAAAAIALLVGGGWILRSFAPPVDHRGSVAANVVPEVTSAKASPIRDSAPLADKLLPAARDIPAPQRTVPRNLTLPAAFLKQVTGPELEGMIDLLEQDAPAQPGLSI